MKGHIAADEFLARKNRVDCRQEIKLDSQLMDVAPSSKAKRLVYNIRKGFETDKENPCVGRDSADFPGGLKSVKSWQADIEQNEVRLQLTSLLNRFHPIGRFSDDDKLRSFPKHRADKSPDGLVILDNEDSKKWHTVE
jgi:hypothetical protein